MKLTAKLIGYLNRAFDKSAKPVLALRLRYDGAMAWRVVDGIFTTTVTGGSGAALMASLSTMTLSQFAGWVASQPGYSVPYVDTQSVGSLAASVLLDGGADQDASNGDHLYAYTSMVWAYLDSTAGDLSLLRAAVAEALAQMAVPTAAGEWIDEHGSYYGVGRTQGESDASYAGRMIAEIGRARGTKIAIAEALRIATGAASVVIDDVTTPTLAGDGTQSYGLFDASVVLDANTQVLNAIALDNSARLVVDAMRDAGTHLRTLRYIRSVPLGLYAGGVVMTGYTIVLSANNSWAQMLSAWVSYTDAWTSLNDPWSVSVQPWKNFTDKWVSYIDPWEAMIDPWATHANLWPVLNLGWKSFTKPWTAYS